MIGDSGVGKTCFLERIVWNSFAPTHITSITPDFKEKYLKLDGYRFKVQIWDTAGQERFRHITTSYFRGAQGYLIFYDVTDRQSFISIRNWMAQIEMHGQSDVPRILIGHKCDVSDQRVIAVEEGANECGIYFFEVSSKVA